MFLKHCVEMVAALVGSENCCEAFRMTKQMQPSSLAIMISNIIWPDGLHSAHTM